MNEPAADNALTGGARPRRRLAALAFALASASIVPAGWMIGRMVKEAYINSGESWMDGPWLSAHWLSQRVFVGSKRFDIEPLAFPFLACTGWSAFLGVTAMWMSTSGRRAGDRHAGAAWRFAILGLILSAIGVVGLGALAALHLWPS